MNQEVTEFLDQLQHPMRAQIDELREMVLKSRPEMEENIKWNGPNFHIGSEDRISIRVHPLNQFHLIFHRGSKPLPQPSEKIITTSYKCLVWKTNDRAVASLLKSRKTLTVTRLT